jgi:uncharacterized membrane protein YdbT with pleckstrin-like domain
VSETTIRPTMKFIRAGYLAVLAIFAAALVVYLTHRDTDLWILPVAAGLLLLWPAARHVRRQTSRATLAGDRLRYETGLASKSTRTLQLSKVQDVRVDQSLAQRIFGVGSISIETAGESSRLTIHNIDAPQRAADLIMDAAHQKDAGGAL